jgi:hypothetical protein
MIGGKFSQTVRVPYERPANGRIADYENRISVCLEDSSALPEDIIHIMRITSHHPHLTVTQIMRPHCLNRSGSHLFRS